MAQPPRIDPPVRDDDHPRNWAAMAVLGAVAFMAQLDLFVVNVALPAMGHTYAGASLSALSWVLNAYTVVFAALLIPAGRLADHFGRRRFLVAGTIIFTMASALCAAAPTLAILIGGRVAQAVGAAVIVPTSLGLLLQAFPVTRHNMVVGLWAGLAAVAGTLGPTVGGLLVGVGWRWIFLINVPIGVLIAAFAVRAVPHHRAATGSRLPDLVSTVALLTAITAFVLAIVEGPSWGWLTAPVLALCAVAAAATAFTVRRSVSQPHALIEASLFSSRSFTGATLALFLYFIGFAAWVLIGVLFLQGVWHYSALRTGLGIAPGPFVALFWSISAGPIGARLGRRVPAIAGASCLAAAGACWIAFAPSQPDYLAGFLPGLVLAGCAAGLVQAPLFAAASTLPAQRATTGSAVLNTARQVGSAVGVALVVVLLGEGHAASLVAFHRGWGLLVVTGVSAAATVGFYSRQVVEPPARS
jgi:EmrB/QacA subfamily drug resistance transporter